MARNFVRASSQDIHVGNVLDITGTARSVAAWINLPDAFISGGRHEVISKEGTTASGWTVAVNAAILGFGVFNSTYYSATGGEILDNTWMHIGGTYAGSVPEIKVYLNGSNTGTGLGPSTGAASDTDLRIGRAAQVVGQYFNGRMAELAVWDATLTDAEMVWLAAGYSPLTVRRDGLVAYFPLIRDVVELRQGLAITDNTTTVGDHPRVFYPARRRFVRRQTIAKRNLTRF